MGTRKISVGSDWDYGQEGDDVRVECEVETNCASRLRDSASDNYQDVHAIKLRWEPSRSKRVRLQFLNVPERRVDLRQFHIELPAQTVDALTYQYQYALASLRKPSACPHCGSEIQLLGERECPEELIYRAVSCPKCGAQYTLTYLCVDVTMDEDGCEQPEPVDSGEAEAQETAATDMDLAADKWLRSRGWQVTEPLGE